MPARKKKRWKETFFSIRFVLILSFLATCLTVIILSAIGSYVTYKNSLLSTIGANRFDVLSQVAGRMQGFKSNAYTVSNLYYNDARFMHYVRNLTEENKEDFFHYMDEVTQQYKISFNQINLDYYVVYLSADGIGYCSLDVPDDYDYINPTIRIWYKNLYESKGKIIDVASYEDKFLNLHSFLAARSVWSESGEIVGYLMINVNEEQLYGTYEDILTPDSCIYITDDQGYIISSSWNKIVGFQYFNMRNMDKLFGNETYAVVEMPDGDALFSRYSNEEYHFTVFERTPLDYILQPIQQTRNIVLELNLAVAFFAAVLAGFFSAKITRPILKMKESVDQGGMDAVVITHTYTELNTLSDGIQKMLGRIRELVDNEKKREAQKRKMQYNLLQAQINPHFMYNTLFSIKCVVDMNENKKASEMLTAFIHLLRSMLSNPDSMNTVYLQMENLRQYLLLQKFRYGDSFDFQITFAEEAGECLLPALLIQPLVENAILHGGFSHYMGKGVISVSALIDGENLVIIVKDNGVGMTREQVESILDYEPENDKPHIGLKNIDERIKLSYGDEYGLTINSESGQGTQVTVKLPVI